MRKLNALYGSSIALAMSGLLVSAGAVMAADGRKLDTGKIEQITGLKGTYNERENVFRVERRAHDGIDLVLEQHHVAHDHRPGAMRSECRPGPQTHEWRHLPSVHRHLDVGPRHADFENVLPLVVGSFQSGDLLDFPRVELSSVGRHDRSRTDQKPAHCQRDG